MHKGGLLSTHKTTNGFTLLEIMVVVTILGLLAAFIVPNVLGSGEKAKLKLAKANMAPIANSLKLYRNDVGRYPTTSQGLIALVEEPSDARNWGPSPYLEKLPEDPWGNEYVYMSPGIDHEYDLLSLGADGEEGGDGFNADISYHDN